MTRFVVNHGLLNHLDGGLPDAYCIWSRLIHRFAALGASYLFLRSLWRLRLRKTHALHRQLVIAFKFDLLTDFLAFCEDDLLAWACRWVLLNHREYLVHSRVHFDRLLHRS